MGVQTSQDVFEYYRYNPSITACVVFITLFSMTTILHLYQLFQTRAWILIPLAVGGSCECLGYVARILSSKESPNYSIGLFVLQSTPTLLAPVLFAATIYMSLGRIIRATEGQHLSPIRLSWLTKMFVAGDIMGFAVQGAGACIMPLGTLQDYHAGSNIVIGGLALMVATFGIFILIAVTYDFRICRQPTPRSLSTTFDWKRDLTALYGSSALIFIRSVHRLVEYSQGNDGWLIRREWTLYVFDATLMLFVMVLFNWWHPSHVAALLDGGHYSLGMGSRIVKMEAEHLDLQTSTQNFKP